jgi:CRP-like cAMP-binding protein
LVLITIAQQPNFAWKYHGQMQQQRHLLHGGSMHSSNVLHNVTATQPNSFYENGSAALYWRSRASFAPWILRISFSKGGMFFLEGEPASGLYILHSGRAKESLLSNSGKAAIVRVLEPGSISGLAAVLNGEAHESTVEALAPCQVDYVKKIDFIRLLSSSPRIGEMVIRQLSRDCKQSYSAIRYLGAAGSTAERLAGLLLQWAKESPLLNLVRGSGKPKSAQGLSFRVTLTQEEIGQSVGTTRETTARILAEFRQKKWIMTDGSVWTLTNPKALRELAEVWY